MVQPSCQPYLESQAHKLLGGYGGMPPRKFLKIRFPNMLFFTISMKDIMYITLKIQVTQNVSIQNDFDLNFFYY